MVTDVCDDEIGKIIIIEIKTKIHFEGEDAYKVIIIIDLTEELIQNREIEKLKLEQRISEKLEKS